MAWTVGLEKTRFDTYSYASKNSQRLSDCYRDGWWIGTKAMSEELSCVRRLDSTLFPKEKVSHLGVVAG